MTTDTPTPDEASSHPPEADNEAVDDGNRGPASDAAAAMPKCGWRRKAGEWWRAQWAAVFLAVDDETAFPEIRDDLRAKLTTGDPELAADLLAEADGAHGRLRERIEGAERRATTLQGASAIAASLTLTAAGLLIDPTKLRGVGWQVLFGLTVVYITFALVMCAWRATLASSRVHRWRAPPDRDILDRVEQGLATARVERAVALLEVIGANQRFARYKVAMLRAATEWIVRALVALLILATLATTYAVFGAEQQSVKPSTAPARTTP